MPGDDLVLNVKQISTFPFKSNAGYGDAVLLQTRFGGPYYQMSAQGLVASALAVDPDRGLGVGAALPPGAGGNILAGNGFVAPMEQGLLFNCFWNVGFTTVEGPILRTGLTYLTSDVAGALVFNEAGFCFLGFAPGQSMAPITSMVAAATLSRTGSLALREQVIVGRDPIGPNEAVTLSYFTLHAIVRNPGNGKLNLTTEDIANAGGATQWNAALAGYPTAQTPVPEARANEIVTAEWALSHFVSSFMGRRGDICLTVDDIVWAGGLPAVSPWLLGKPKGPTAEVGAADDQLATTQFVQEALDAHGVIAGPPGPPGPPGPAGTGIDFKGTVPTQADLPASGNSIGDMYIALDTNDGYIWEQNGWQLIGMITPQTAVLVDLNPPVNPTQGDLWWDNATAQLMLYYAGNWVVANLGAVGPQGPPGTPGAVGPQGPQGPTGGANAPISTTPPASPNQGDFWWNSTQGLLMVYINGTWVPAAGAGAASAAIGGTQSLPVNAIMTTGWGYVYGAAGNQAAPGGPYGNFMFVCQPDLGFPPGNSGSALGDGINAYLFATQVNAWNYGAANSNRPVLTRIITGLPQPAPGATVQVATGAIVPQGFYFGGQLTSNQGFCRYNPQGSTPIPTASMELFYSDGVNFTCTGNTIGQTASFIPVRMSGLNNGIIGPTTTFAAGSLVPAGVWYMFDTENNSNNSATLVLLPGSTGASPSPLNPNRNFMFFSDGTNIEIASGPAELNQVVFR